ncbi:MAG: hypothetical protein RIC85_06405 [Gammaproteobacteria bacterium]
MSEEEIWRGAGLALHLAPNMASFQQGDLDGLCGLYSVINAIRIARYPIRPLSMKECSDLFQNGVSRLSKTGHLAEFVCEGMEWRYVSNLATSLCKAASVDNRILRPRKPKSTFDKRQRWEWIIHQISKERPVMIHLSKRDHYSVITGISQKRIRLFDSSASYWANRDDRDVIRLIAIAT